MAATAMTISTAVLLLLPLTISATSSDFITANCKTTLYPDVCNTKLIPQVDKIQESPVNLARVALDESLSSVTSVKALISTKPKSDKDLQDCVSTYGDAIDQIQKSKTELLQDKLNPESINNVQTWMSAAITNQDTCEEGLGSVKSDVHDRVVEGKKLTSIALAFINKVADTMTQAIPLETPVV